MREHRHNPTNNPGQKPRQRKKLPLWVPLLQVLTLMMAAIGLMIVCIGIRNVLNQSLTQTAQVMQAEPAQTNENLMSPAEAQAAAEALALAAEESYLPPPPTLEDVEGITVDLLPESKHTWGSRSLETVNAIVVHYTANPGTTAQQNRSYFASLAKTGADSLSAHFVIGMDGTIVQCVPLNYCSSASNNRNGDTVSIECCHPDNTGAFTQETRAALVSLLRYLCNGYHLDRDQIIRHYDITGKLCPLYYCEHPDEWEALKDDVYNR